MKLQLAHAVMAGFVLLLVLGTTSAMNTLEREFETLSKQTLEMTRELEKMHSAGLGIIADTISIPLLQSSQYTSTGGLRAERSFEREAQEEQKQRKNKIRAYHAAFAAYVQLVERYFPDEGALKAAIDKSGRALIAGTDVLLAPANQLSRRGEFLESLNAVEKLEQAFSMAIETAQNHELEEFGERGAGIRTTIANLKLFAWLGLALVSIAIALVGGILTRNIVPPLRQLTAAAETMGQGYLDTRVTLNRSDELGVLETAFNQMANSLQASIAEREEAEDRLRESQKIQAVGQLTGGIAHDFNNLLAVILGNAELAIGKGMNGCDHELNAITRSANRGAELTQRLLAFSRQQPLQPRAIDISALIDGMADLLRRTLGETITISVASADDLWFCMADAGQVENALLNLALNARDAMPEGGTLSIDCSNARLSPDETGDDPEFVAGDYVVLNVTDSGTGMAADVMARACEPFFTTKDVGMGSGLGLSMIYGFAKQSGGQIKIYSELGQGTTIRLYLPRATQTAVAEERLPITDVSSGGGKSVLIVEDDETVLAVVMAMLQAMGYRASTALTAADAYAILEKETVDLVLSDVVLPGGVNGPVFAERARALHPGLKVIFMSGYPAESTVEKDLISADDILLSKPFKQQQLAYALRDALT